MTSCVLRFPDERLATFTCSFGAADGVELRPRRHRAATST